MNLFVISVYGKTKENSPLGGPDSISIGIVHTTPHRLSLTDYVHREGASRGLALHGARNGSADLPDASSAYAETIQS